jgi:lipopolysaccharide export system protein LptA
MPITIEKLRRWILQAALLTVAGVVALLLYGQHERRKLLRDLPGKLGIDIQQQTSEFTYSQSIQGKTLFTLHAAKAVQMKLGGHIKLHDVTIILYGRKQDRADRIAGQEFEYDPASGIARAEGDVFLDLQAPAKTVAASVKSSAEADADKNLASSGSMVHVTTKGLVFQQKEGLASTDQDITFQFGGGVTGHAHGAQYDSARGIITLDAAVTADTMQNGNPVHVTAAHGELNRDTNLCVFTHVAYTTRGETATADHAAVLLRTDGSADRVETDGNVTLTLAHGGTVQTPHAVLTLTTASEPKDMVATGGVHYADNAASAGGTARAAQGDSAAAHIVFDAHGQAQRAELTGGVHTLEREKQKAAAAWTERELHAAMLTIDFHTVPGTAPVMHQATATGNARLRVTAPVQAKPGTGSMGSESTVLAGDSLVAIFTRQQPPSVESLHGAGHTVLTQTAANGAVNESRGDTLDAVMRPRRKTAAHAQKVAESLAAQIEHAVQQGHVTLAQTPAVKPGSSAEPMNATAARAEYTGSDDALLLTGTPQADPAMTDGGMQVAARRIRVARTTGDAVLTGNIRGNYAGTGTQGATHVVADHAEIHRGSQHAIFFGSSAQPRARLWQDASQVEAPILDFDRAAQRLIAFGDSNDAAAVHAVLAGNSASPSTAHKAADLMRVSSRRMVYTSPAADKKMGAAAAQRQAEFNSGVNVQSSDGTIRAQRALVYLAPVAAGGKPQQANAGLPVLDGSVQRIVASGQVTLETGERRGSGEQLVYTPNPAPVVNPSAPAAHPTNGNSGQFVLTGTPGAPPRLFDPAKGSITGASLIFNSGDDSVVVSGGSTNGRVHTELKVNR